MGKLNAFIFISLDGYYEAEPGDISWHTHGMEENEYSNEGLGKGGILLFGRKTYEMMVKFWPTPAALENNPVVAEGMNKAEKIVFSRTLKKAEWNNTRIVNDNIIEGMQNLKQLSEKDMVLLGSGSILTQFAEHGLLDEIQVMVDHVALGGGTPIFKCLQHKLDLRLTSSRIFKDGNVLLTYQPIGKA